MYKRQKQGFETPDSKRVDVETAFKDPKHPFRVAVVCAMWLTGFDVECPVSYTHLRAHETVLDLVCRLLLEKKKKEKKCLL